MKKKKIVSDNYLLKLWRKVILLKYNNRCAFCGFPGPLEAHHIVKRRNKILRYDSENGMALCSACHREADLIEGRVRVAEIVGEDCYYNYLAFYERMTYKQYLFENCMSDNEFLITQKEELKKLIKED